MQRGQPKYQILLDWIKKELKNGKLAQGDRFYSEAELCAMFDISRQTVRHALDILEAESVLERRRGSGTFVSAPSVSPVVGVITTYVDDYIFPRIIQGIERVLRRHNYGMQLAFTHNRVENETQVLRNLMNMQVAGFIVEPTQSGLPNPNLPYYEEILRQRIPMIFFDAYYPGLSAPYVMLDDRQAGRMAAQYLIDRGHIRIAALLPFDDIQGHLRYAGYLDALIQAGIRHGAENVLWFATEDIPHLFENASRILAHLAQCSAIICYNDKIATELLAFLARQKVRTPEDVSVISIDNSHLAEFCDPPLTSVNHPKELLGETVAGNLLRLMEEPDYDATMEFQPELQIRASVQRPSARPGAHNERGGIKHA